MGESAMQAATRHDISGILAECGGNAMCATCHVYVDEAWFEKLAPRSPDEEYQLDAAFDVRPTSRLSCQIVVSEELDGLVVRTPAYQGR
jgi:2Fe-2S ferredoxin